MGEKKNYFGSATKFPMYGQYSKGQRTLQTTSYFQQPSLKVWELVSFQQLGTPKVEYMVASSTTRERLCGW